MGTIYNRGTRAKPNWWIAYYNADGQRRYSASRQPTKALARRYLERVEARIADGLVGIEEPHKEPRCKELLTTWAGGLTNRGARDDRNRMRRHLLPVFGERRLKEITLPVIMVWIDDQRAAGQLAEQSILHNLHLLSRFFSWAIERGMTEVNPTRQIPVGKRPKRSHKQKVPWLQDDAVVLRLIRELREPVNYMFYLGNRSGMRTGEIAGLRMSDLAYLGDGVIRVSHSYDGPLKEDKEGGKTKWAPAADDAEAFLRPWLERRRDAGAGPEDYVFPSATNRNRPCNPTYITTRWYEARSAVGLDITWYQATRHTFTSRLLAAGAKLDEVSAALGHSSPVITRRHYDHFIRRTFSSGLRTGLGLSDARGGDPAQENLGGSEGDASRREQELQAKIAQLTAELAKKDEVIAELSVQYEALKKSTGAG